MTSIVIFTRKYHINFTSDYSSGIQKLHKKIVPRVGGIQYLHQLSLLFYFGHYQFTRGNNAIIIGAFPAFFFWFIG